MSKNEKYRANYIIKDAKILNPGNSISNEINTFVAAKEVAVIDNYAEKLGIECHAGHGLDFSTVKKIAAIPNIVELNIGHFLIGEAIFEGLEQSISRMRALIENARSKVLKD